jgi:hypothetical protein
MQDYLKMRENQLLLAQLNEAYEDLPNGAEAQISKSMRVKHSEIIEQELW